MSPTTNRADLEDSFKIHVLLVDDNEAFLRIATEFLQRHDELTVVGAICRGEEVLAQAQELQPQVILTGLDRPGLETISRLRKLLPGVGIIALTLLEGAAHRKAAMATGADDVVLKAELTTDLLPAIRWAMQIDRSRQRLVDATAHPSPRLGSRCGSLSAPERSAVV